MRLRTLHALYSCWTPGSGSRNADAKQFLFTALAQDNRLKITALISHRYDRAKGAHFAKTRLPGVCWIVWG